MPARTGRQYLTGLREQEREVWIGGERVKDVTKHPAFRNTARMVARLYDALHDPKRKDKILLPTDAGFVPLECDITSAVQSWLASPAGSERVIKVSVSAPADRTASILTALTPDGTQRPVLSLDYSGKCSGKVCPQLVE